MDWWLLFIVNSVDSNLILFIVIWLLTFGSFGLSLCFALDCLV